MADEIKTVIVFTTGGELEVTESPDQITNAIDGVTSRHVALVKVTDAKGIAHWINALEIVEYHPPILPGGPRST